MDKELSLIERINRNWIIQQTGKLSDPFSEKDVTTRYAMTAMKLISIQHGQKTLDTMIDYIVSHLPDIVSRVDRERFMDYMENEYNKIDIFLHHLFLEYGSAFLGIEKIHWFVGNSTINPNLNLDFKLIAGGELFGIQRIYEEVARLCPIFTDFIEMEFLKNKSRTGLTVITRRTKPKSIAKYRRLYDEMTTNQLLKNDDELTRGVLEGVPKAVNSRYASATLTHQRNPDGIEECENLGAEKCVYLIKWTPEIYADLADVPKWHPEYYPRVLNNFLKSSAKALVSKVPFVRKSLDTLIRDQIIIQQQTEEGERGGKERERQAAENEILRVYGGLLEGLLNFARVSTLGLSGLIEELLPVYQTLKQIINESKIEGNSAKFPSEYLKELEDKIRALEYILPEVQRHITSIGRQVLPIRPSFGEYRHSTLKDLLENTYTLLEHQYKEKCVRNFSVSSNTNDLPSGNLQGIRYVLGNLYSYHANNIQEANNEGTETRGTINVIAEDIDGYIQITIGDDGKPQHLQSQIKPRLLDYCSGIIRATGGELIFKGGLPNYQNVSIIRLQKLKPA